MKLNAFNPHENKINISCKFNSVEELSKAFDQIKRMIRAGSMAGQSLTNETPFSFEVIKLNLVDELKTTDDFGGFTEPDEMIIQKPRIEIINGKTIHTYQSKMNYEK